MTEEAKQEFVDTYLKYLRWNRLPEKIPTTKSEARAIFADIQEHANQNPYTDDIWLLFDVIHSAPDLAWDLLLRIIAATDEPDLGTLGAGDLETFVHVQAVPYAAQIEQEIRTNAKLRTAFKSVYIGSDTPAPVGRAFNDALRESGVGNEDIIDWWTNEAGT